MMRICSDSVLVVLVFLVVAFGCVYAEEPIKIQAFSPSADYSTGERNVLFDILISSDYGLYDAKLDKRRYKLEGVNEYRIKEYIPLNPGSNKIILTVSNDLGDQKIVFFNVYVDSSKPRIHITENNDGSIFVLAKDDEGLMDVTSGLFDYRSGNGVDIFMAQIGEKELMDKKVVFVTARDLSGNIAVSKYKRLVTQQIKEDKASSRLAASERELIKADGHFHKEHGSDADLLKASIIRLEHKGDEIIGVDDGAVFKDKVEDDCEEIIYGLVEISRGLDFIEIIGKQVAVDDKLNTDEMRREWQSDFEKVYHKGYGTKQHDSKEDCGIDKTIVGNYETILNREYKKYIKTADLEWHTLSGIRENVLDPDEVVLEYILGETRSYLIYISSSSVKVRELPPAKEIEDKVRIFRRNINDHTSWRNVVDLLASELYHMLIAPVKEEIQSAGSLLIVPSGCLNFLPFESLKMYEGNEKIYLTEKYRIRYAPTLNVTHLMTRRTMFRENPIWDEKTREWLGFTGPACVECGSSSLDSGAVDGAASTKDAHSGTRTGVESGHNMVKAQTAGPETVVEAVARMFGSEINLMKNKEIEFKTMVPLGYRYVHVAAPFDLDNEGGEQPFVLSGLAGSGDSGDDGLVKMLEILNMKMTTDIVVLSPCDTEQVKVSGGERAAGLSRAFFYAGADPLVFGLWRTR